jgi:predicted nucleic acid-binding protein
MGNKLVFLDANILLDIIGANRPEHHEAKELWKMLTSQNYKISISEDILTNVYYISKEKNKVLEFFKVIQNRWLIFPFGKEVIKSGIELAIEKNLDLEDILQCLCAKENGCGYLITNDKKFYDCGIKIMTTKEFIENEI